MSHCRWVNYGGKERFREIFQPCIYLYIMKFVVLGTNTSMLHKVSFKPGGYGTRVDGPDPSPRAMTRRVKVTHVDGP